MTEYTCRKIGRALEILRPNLSRPTRQKTSFYSLLFHRTKNCKWIIDVYKFRVLCFNIFKAFDKVAFSVRKHRVIPNSQWILLRSSSELKDLIWKLFAWFTQSEMKANVSKCSMLLSNTEVFNFQISGAYFTLEKVVRSNHYNKLRSKKHISTVCQRDNRKLNALAILTPYIELEKDTY